jgi:hypothetical protein
VLLGQLRNETEEAKEKIEALGAIFGRHKKSTKGALY